MHAHRLWSAGLQLRVQYPIFTDFPLRSSLWLSSTCPKTGTVALAKLE